MAEHSSDYLTFFTYTYLLSHAMLTLQFSSPDSARTFRSALVLPLSLTALLLTSSCATTGEQDAGGTATATATTTTDAGAGTATDAGAAGAGTTDMSAMPKSARTMLTSAEVSGIVGRPVVLQAGSDSTAAMATTTASFVPSALGSDNAAATPIVTVRLAGDGQLADSRDMARNGRHKMADVPSLGRTAYYDDSEGSLYVNDKGQTLIITVPNQVQGKTRQQVATQLGRIATGRM